MKPAYVICALLSVTIGTLVLAENGAQTKAGTQLHGAIVTLNPVEQSEMTTAVPSKTNTSTIVVTTQNTSPTANASTTATTATTITTSTITPNTTTPEPTTTTKPTTAPSNLTTTTSSTTTTTPSPKPTSSSSTTPGTTATTPVPLITTAVPPSSKDRQFDGLSFFGGIVLTTCLMAIAAFSWKFYRQCKEGNYRTL